MDSINKILEQFWEANFQALSRPPTVWLAYSGGLDSHVLVHSLAGVRHVSDTICKGRPHQPQHLSKFRYVGTTLP
jgi:PP-loop superfamily ATP-utilizing enzyme